MLNSDILWLEKYITAVRLKNTKDETWSKTGQQLD